MKSTTLTPTKPVKTYRILERKGEQSVVLRRGLTKEQARKAIGEGRKNVWVSGPAIVPEEE